MEITKEKLQEQINKLQEQLDNFKEPSKFIEGKWYIYEKDPTKMACYTLNKPCYGIWGESGWSNSLAVADKRRWTEATDKEVKNMLIKEAEKRGFVENAKFLDARYGVNNYIFKSSSQFKLRGNNALCIERGGNGTIFHNGKWAEIIKDSKPKVNGYEMKVNSNEVSFGCAKFNKYQLFGFERDINIFNNVIVSNRKIKSIKLDSGVEITVEQLEEIINYLNKNE